MPSACSRGRFRRRTSCIEAPRSPREAPHTPRGAVREARRRRTSCIGALRSSRASLGTPSASIGVPSGAPLSSRAPLAGRGASLTTPSAARRARGRAGATPRVRSRSSWAPGRTPTSRQPSRVWSSVLGRHDGGTATGTGSGGCLAVLPSQYSAVDLRPEGEPLPVSAGARTERSYRRASLAVER
jgi:hypothetical protein